MKLLISNWVERLKSQRSLVLLKQIKEKSFQWPSTNLIIKEEEILVLVKWSKETGNAANAAQKSQNFLLSRLRTDQYIAKIAGLKKDLQGSAANSDSAKNIHDKTWVFCFLIFFCDTISKLKKQK